MSHARRRPAIGRGGTALMLAAERGDIELAKVLLKNGAERRESQRRDRTDASAGERPSGSGQNSARPSR
jgi:ankyrin repeat protein